MKYSWIKDITEFQALAEDWDAAMFTSGSSNPFLLSEFIICWWKRFGAPLKLNIIVFYENGRICAGLPLYMEATGFKSGFFRVLRYIGGSAANYTEPFCRVQHGNLLAAFSAALDERDDWDALCLSDVNESCCLLSDYRAGLLGDGILGYVVQDHMNWSIDLSGGADKYFASLSKKMMKDLRAKRKHALKDYGPLKLVRIQGGADIEKYFAMYEDFSRQAFKSRNRKSSFADAQYAAFFREFILYMDSRSWLDCHALFAGDTVLAISFAYAFGKGFNWVLTAFNYECRYVRPGYLLIEELVKYVHEKNEVCYNWYGYERFYKEQWCNTRQPLSRFILVKRSFRGAFYRYLKGFENFLRSNPRIVALVRKMRLV